MNIIKSVRLCRPLDDNNLSDSIINQELSSVSMTYTKIKVSTDIYRTKSYTANYQSQYSSSPFKWVGILLNVGDPITNFSLNGVQLTSDDIDKSKAAGGSSNEILLWVRADIVRVLPRKISIGNSTESEQYFIYGENVGMPPYSEKASITDPVDDYNTGIGRGGGSCDCGDINIDISDVDLISGGNAFSD